MDETNDVLPSSSYVGLASVLGEEDLDYSFEPQRGVTVAFSLSIFFDSYVLALDLFIDAAVLRLSKFRDKQIVPRQAVRDSKLLEVQTRHLQMHSLERLSVEVKEDILKLIWLPSLGHPRFDELHDHDLIHEHFEHVIRHPSLLVVEYIDQLFDFASILSECEVRINRVGIRLDELAEGSVEKWIEPRS